MIDAATTTKSGHPPGFVGLHPDKSIRKYYRHLPHWRQNGATYFVTFRLADSLPLAKLIEILLAVLRFRRRRARVPILR